MPKNGNAKPCSHEHEPSLTEAGLEVCHWCGDTREAAPAPVVGVDLPGAAVRDVVRARAA